MFASDRGSRDARSPLRTRSPRCQILRSEIRPLEPGLTVVAGPTNVEGGSAGVDMRTRIGGTIIELRRHRYAIDVELGCRRCDAKPEFTYIGNRKVMPGPVPEIDRVAGSQTGAVQMKEWHTVLNSYTELVFLARSSHNYRTGAQLIGINANPDRYRTRIAGINFDVV